MRLERPHPGATGPALGARVGMFLAAAALLSAAWLRLGLPRPVCQIKHWTGIPCPTCGSTRLVEALLRGDFAEAASWNPLLFGAAALVVVWACASALRATVGLRPWRLVLDRRERATVGLVAVAAVATGWAYLVWRGI